MGHWASFFMRFPTFKCSGVARSPEWKMRLINKKQMKVLWLTMKQRKHINAFTGGQRRSVAAEVMWMCTVTCKGHSGFQLAVLTISLGYFCGYFVYGCPSVFRFLPQWSNLLLFDLHTNWIILITAWIDLNILLSKATHTESASLVSLSLFFSATLFLNTKLPQCRCGRSRAWF